jgi:hypothetical protein
MHSIASSPDNWYADRAMDGVVLPEPSPGSVFRFEPHYGRKGHIEEGLPEPQFEPTTGLG